MIDGRRRGSVDIRVWMQLLGALDAAAADLQCPIASGAIRKAYRRRVELAGFDVVAPFVRFAPPEHGAFELDVVHYVADRPRALSDIRRFEPVYRDRRL